MGYFNNASIVLDGLQMLFDGNSSYANEISGCRNLINPTKNWVCRSGGAYDASKKAMVYNNGNSYSYVDDAEVDGWFTDNEYTIDCCWKLDKIGDPASNCGDKRYALWTKMGNSGTLNPGGFDWFYKGHICGGSPSGGDPVNATTGSHGYSVPGSGEVSQPSGFGNQGVGMTISINTIYYTSYQYRLFNNATQFQVAMYVNGELFGQSGVGNRTVGYGPQGDFRIGGRNNNCGNGSMDGDIYMFRFYNRRLTDTEIYNNYLNTKSLYGL
jgi:hypothetical protein